MSTPAQRNEETVMILQTRLNERGEKLVVDGDGGPKTRAALDRQLPGSTPALKTVTPPVSLPAQTLRSQHHYARAKEYLGLKEQSGPGTHPKIKEMLALAPSWLDQDDSKTAWCGLFRGYIGHLCATGMPADHYRAAAWANWGVAVPLNNPAAWQRGDTIIMRRTGGNHVALLDRVEGNKVYCLGGNQSNAVTIAPFDLSLITAVRR